MPAAARRRSGARSAPVGGAVGGGQHRLIGVRSGGGQKRGGYGKSKGCSRFVVDRPAELRRCASCNMERNLLRGALVERDNAMVFFKLVGEVVETGISALKPLSIPAARSSV